MDWFLIVYLFFFIYIPPILQINIMHLITIFSLVVIAIKYQNLLFYVIKQSKLRIIFIVFLIAFFYLLIVIWLTSGQFIYLYNYSMILIEIPICSLFVLLYAIEKKYDFLFLLRMILITGLIQAVISMATFFYTPLQIAIIKLFIENGIGEVFETFYSTRSFGFSSFMTSTEPITQAVLANIAFILGIYKNKKYLLFIPFLFFSAMINSRTSIFVFGLGVVIILFMFFAKLNLKKVFGIIVLLIAAPLLFDLLFSIVQSYSVLTYNWIMTGINEVKSFLNGNNIGYFKILLTFITIPEGFVLFFGKGVSLFGLSVGSSDVGFINSLWLGGLLLTLWVYGGLSYFYLYSLKQKDPVMRSISLIIMISFIVANIKGSTIFLNEFANSSILITSMMIFYASNHYIDRASISKFKLKVLKIKKSSTRFTER